MLISGYATATWSAYGERRSRSTPARRRSPSECATSVRRPRLTSHSSSKGICAKSSVASLSKSVRASSARPTFVVKAREHAVDDRIRPERQLAQVGLERLGKLVEPALAASQEVELQSVRHHGVPARCCSSELERLVEQALSIVETTFEQREQRLVYRDQPVLRRLAQLLGKLHHLA